MYNTQATVPGMPAQPIITPEMMREKAWDNLVYAAKAHAEAVARGVAFDGGSEAEGDRLVDDILRKGQTLDSCILSARMHGFEVEAIAAVEGLHPAYAAELVRMSEGFSPF